MSETASVKPAPPLTPPRPTAPAQRTQVVQPAPKRAAEAPARLQLSPIPDSGGRRVVLYGPGGIGKSTLAACAPSPVAFFDLDDSLPRLRKQLGESPEPLKIYQISGADTWKKIREILHGDGWDEVKTIVIDSATRAEELAVFHTLETVPHEKGQKVTRIEDYGFGKGYQHVYDTFLGLLGDLDQHARAGRNVVLVCHDCVATVPNPAGEDWIRYEPRLQSLSSGKSSIRLRVREWADDVLFIGYDVNVKDGTGQGSGTRTIYPSELPHCMAKCRAFSEPLSLSKFDATLWRELMG